VYLANLSLKHASNITNGTQMYMQIVKRKYRFNEEQYFIMYKKEVQARLRT